MWREQVGAVYAAWNGRDLDRALQVAHPDIVVRQDPATPGAFEGVGRQALRAWLEGFFETWEEFRITLERVVERGDRVVVVAHIHARGRSSGVEVENRVGHVHTMHDGLIVRLETYASPAAALRAAGVPEEPPPTPPRTARR